MRKGHPKYKMFLPYVFSLHVTWIFFLDYSPLNGDASRVSLSWNPYPASSKLSWGCKQEHEMGWKGVPHSMSAAPTYCHHYPCHYCHYFNSSLPLKSSLCSLRIAATKQQARIFGTRPNKLDCNFRSLNKLGECATPPCLHFHLCAIRTGYKLGWTSIVLFLKDDNITLGLQTENCSFFLARSAWNRKKKKLLITTW